MAPMSPNVRGAPTKRGVTPILRHRTRRDKVSVISGLSVSPVRHRVGLYYRFSLNNIGQAEVVTFLRQLLRHLRGPVIVLFDNARIHTAAQVRTLARRHPRLHLEHFPGYAPELNLMKACGPSPSAHWPTAVPTPSPSWWPTS